jgi:hypothetical protein
MHYRQGTRYGRARTRQRPRRRRDFQVHIEEPERAKEWQEVLETTTVTVQSPIPRKAVLPGIGEALVYLLDLDSLTDAQRERLSEHISQKFQIPREEVAARLDREGVPLLARDCTVIIKHPQKWF